MRQTSAVSEICRASATRYTAPWCMTSTIVTRNMMGSTTVLDELRQIANQRKPWITVLTEIKMTDAKQDRVFVQEYLLEYSHTSRAVQQSL